MTDIVLTSEHDASIVEQQLADNYSILFIEHPKFSASVSLYGGHVLTWQPANEKPVLWLSNTAEYKQGKAIRGGIPICWPWFGTLLNENGDNLGNHGFARTNSWQLTSYNVTPDDVTLVLTFAGDNAHHAWQGQFEVEQTLIFSTTLQQQLEIKNHTRSLMTFGQALHTYFAVSDPKNVQVPQLSAHVFDDKMTGQTQQKSELSHCLGPLDRIYYTSDAQLIIDREWQRTIKVTSEKCQQWVLWNPGHEIAAGMHDIHQGGENEYVCLEAANTQWREIAPGNSFILGQTIEII